MRNLTFSNTVTVLISYSLLDAIHANASSLETILHFYNLRHYIDGAWSEFLVDSVKMLPKLREEDCPSFAFCSQDTVLSLNQVLLFYG